ncbi:ABC transporter ATP-binding protein [Rhodoferax koreense]|uniref:ABC transporter ATP-binding protein n=1 Tax=Rhodoferax koreensis TaxID=1842727 RepID=A0A1P8JXC5_9BURK|nr:ATP-binding cassette domain-containing protein [Rhodoferax koreense]APW38351.1 ABC transporter ATP-binding protein [Rhodoferax koreense]
MIDVDIALSVADRSRRFDLAVRFATDAPFAALYGPSGSGKTLTLQAIAGLLRPSRGHIRIDGRTLFDAQAGVDLAPAVRRTGYLFQNYALFPHLSVRQNVAFGLTSWHRGRLSAQERERVQHLLESFDLATTAESRPATLSGGQQQRVALARALACEPQVLLLDEPFASLNPMLRQNLREELAEVRRRWGIPALMITHDVEDVLALADVAFIYERGQIVQQIGMHDASSRDMARIVLDGPLASDTSPLKQKLRKMLQASWSTP